MARRPAQQQPVPAEPPKPAGDTGSAAKIAKIAMIGTIVAATITGLATVSAGVVPRLFGGGEQKAVGGSSASTVVSRNPEAPAPMTVAVQQSDDYCFSGWVVPKSPPQLETPVPEGELVDWSAWARRAGGVKVNRHEVVLTVQGISEARVVIDRVRVVTLEPRRLPLRGTLVEFACGDAVEYRYLEANLDRNPPGVTSKTTGSVSGEHDVRLDPARFPYQVALDEAESFVVRSVVSKFDVDWRVEIDWSSQGRTGTFVVDDNGQPFHTTSSASAEATCSWADDGTLLKDLSIGCTR
jgi:hypothetical protein